MGCASGRSAPRPRGIVFNSARSATLAVGFVVGSVACSDESSDPQGPAGAATRAPEQRTPAADELDPLYARDHVVEVVIELDPADWQALRAEGRTVVDGFSGADQTFAYTEYVGTASVDGQQYENVLVRKKGYLGSLSRVRPSLKLDFGEVEDAVGRAFERLTLNNNRGDYSRARTCLAYDVFARAGIPAPRCNLAHVVVNGEDLGTYSNVEPIRKPMLKRHFGDASGVLYEGQLVDFVEADLPKFQLKTDEPLHDRSALHALAAELGAEGTDIATQLGGVIDVPRFREFWAAETLAAHWDGYAGNRNNFYLYENPTSGRLEFIPWGTDGAFAESIPGDASNSGVTVYARGLLANRLYGVPAERAHFRARLGALNDLVWNEAELIGELQRIAARAPDALPDATASLAEFVDTHGKHVQAELGKRAPEWVHVQESPCAGMTSNVRFEFTTDYGDVEAIEPGVGSFDADFRFDGSPIPTAPNAWFGRAGVVAPTADPTIALRAMTFFEDGRGILVELNIPPEEFSPGRRPLHGFETAGVVVVLDEANSRFVGFITDGTLQLDAAAAATGAAVSGNVEGTLMQLGCAALPAR